MARGTLAGEETEGAVTGCFKLVIWSVDGTFEEIGEDANLAVTREQKRREQRVERTRLRLCTYLILRVGNDDDDDGMRLVMI